MLLELYDRAILATRAAEEAKLTDRHQFAENFLEAQKYILAIQSGLNPDDHEIAMNISRLLHFASTQLASHQFAAAIDVLQSLRSGFEAIREEATQLEQEGVIPPINLTSGFNALA